MNIALYKQGWRFKHQRVKFLTTKLLNKKNVLKFDKIVKYERIHKFFPSLAHNFLTPR
jgi:hypothetical protein